MQLVTDQALVLDHLRFGDHDAIVVLLTLQHGRQTVFAKGAHRSRPRFGGRLEPYSHLEVDWRPPRAHGLSALGRADLLDDHRALRSAFDSLCVAAFAAEVIRESCPESHELPEIFDLFRQLLDHLVRGNPGGAAAWIAFQLQLAARLGYGLALECCTGCGLEPPPGRRVVIVPEQGGIVCSECRRQLVPPGSSVCSAAQLVELVDLQRRSLLDVEWPALAHRSVQLARQLLPPYLEHITGRPLRSLSLLAYGA